MSRRVLAPDGIAWPAPFVAVSKEEQHPWTFGWRPYADRLTDRSDVASDVPDDGSVIWRKFATRFHLVSHDLHTADYWLIGPDGPLDGFVCVERKERDAVATFTTERARFGEELDRMRSFHNPLLVASCSVEALLEGHPQHEASFLGTMASMAAKYRVPTFFAPNREWAERFAAWCLIEWWQGYLVANASALTWAREQERLRGIEREHKRAQRKAGKPPAMVPPAEQFDAPAIGTSAWGRGKRRPAAGAGR